MAFNPIKGSCVHTLLKNQMRAKHHPLLPWYKTPFFKSTHLYPMSLPHDLPCWVFVAGSASPDLWLIPHGSIFDRVKQLDQSSWHEFIAKMHLVVGDFSTTPLNQINVQVKIYGSISPQILWG